MGGSPIRALSRKTSLFCGAATISNALHFLIMADLHSSEMLKDKTIDYINKNKKTLASTKAWDDFAASYPQFVLELYETIS